MTKGQANTLLVYVGNSELLHGCLNRTCEEGEFLRQEMLTCPEIPFLKVCMPSFPLLFVTQN